MNRRGILKALMGAPIAAPAMAQQAAAGLAAGQQGLGIRSGATCVGSEPVDPISDAFWRHRYKAITKASAHANPLPPHIATKKSWSPTFKQHVAEVERREMEAIWGFGGEISQEHMIRVLKAIGVAE